MDDACHFQTLDGYRLAARFLPAAYALAKRCDSEMAGQLRRAALSIMLNIAEGTGRVGRDEHRFLIIARGSAFECAAVLDAIRIVVGDDPTIAEGQELLLRIVQILTKMLQKPLRVPGSTTGPKR